MDVAAEDVDEFLAYAREENLEATVIATVTEDPRMVMTWNGDKIVNLSREFLASNGASKHQTVHVEEQQSYETPWGEGTLAERMNKLVTDINVASNKGLSERFDSTIGAGTVLMPFGGKRQLTPNMAMVAKLPVFGETTTLRRWRGASTRTSCPRTSSPAPTCPWSSRWPSWSRPASSMRRPT